MDWQPIETAPKDGTWIELYRPPLEQGGIRQTHILAKWHVGADDCASFCWPDDVYDIVSERGKAMADEDVENGDCYETTENWTHWRPISIPQVQP